MGRNINIVLTNCSHPCHANMAALTKTKTRTKLVSAQTVTKPGGGGGGGSILDANSPPPTNYWPEAPWGGGGGGFKERRMGGGGSRRGLGGGGSGRVSWGGGSQVGRFGMEVGGSPPEKSLKMGHFGSKTGSKGFKTNFPKGMLYPL